VLAFAAAAAVAVATSDADSDCSLSALRIWGEGSLLRLEPAFSPEVLRYKAALDHGASALWVDAEADEAPARSGSGGVTGAGSGNCQARRSDAGLGEGRDGEVIVAVAGTDGTKPREYAVEVTRRAGDDVELHALAVQGGTALQLAPAFSPGTLEYSADVTGGDGSLVEVSCGPADMGQSLRVSLESSHADEASEVPPRLDQLQFRRRNFTLGKVVSGGAKLQIPGSQRGHTLPVRAKIEVWPASVAGDSMPAGPPSRTYIVVLKPRGSLVAATKPGHDLGEGSGGSRRNGGGGGSGGGSATGAHTAFGLSCSAILAIVLWLVFQNAPEAIPEDAPMEYSPREQAEDSVQRAFDVARGSMDQDPVGEAP